MKLKFLGAARTVTGSQTLVSHNGHSFLVDCGIFQGPKAIRELNWQIPKDLNRVETIVLTHAHLDHSGLLPRWVKLGWEGKVYCTPATFDLLQILLLDAAKLQEEDARFANKTKYSNHKPALPLYEEKDALMALSCLESIDYDQWAEIQPGVSIQFLRAGHILGSAILQIAYSQEEESRIITFSGDLGGGHSEIIKQPASSLESTHLVVESTYGNRNVETSHRDVDLASAVNKVCRRGGTLVVPAFALGRTQDLLVSLYQLKAAKLIDDFPIYLDSPMANSVTKVYLSNQRELLLEHRSLDFLKALSPPFFTPVVSSDDSMILCMSREPKVVISASGMLQGGRVLRHLVHKLRDESNGVLFVGFQGEGTKGRVLLEGAKKMRIYHEEIDVEAEIFSIAGYSAHGDQNDILGWVESFRSELKSIFINHGEAEAGEALAEKLRTISNASIFRPVMGEEFDLI
jgi:metallo-beta-lactamase family protein